MLKLVQQIGAGPPDTMATSWQPPPAILFLNKQDKLDSNIRATVLQQLRKQLGGMLNFQHVFEGAAMRGEGVDELKDHLVKQVRGTVGQRSGDCHACVHMYDSRCSHANEGLRRCMIVAVTNSLVQ